MTRRQLLSMYYESFRVEAAEQLRLVFAFKFGHPQSDASDYIESLKVQMDPPDTKEDEKIGITGVQRAMRLFGKEIKGDARR